MKSVTRTACHALLMLLLLPQAIADTVLRSPYDIIDDAPSAHWRSIDPENTLYLELTTGTVTIELFAAMAPHHVENIHTLAREDFYDGLSIYRVIDGFVASSGQLEPARPNPIISMQVAADLDPDQRPALEVMDTRSASFLELVASRAKRPEPWFLERPRYVDVCGIPVPVRSGAMPAP